MRKEIRYLEYIMYMICNEFCLSNYIPIPVTVRSRAWLCGRTISGNAGSNPANGSDVTSLQFLSCVGSGLCDELITCPEESYRVCASVCLSVCPIVCDLETSKMRRPMPVLGRSNTEKN
jgi:hypothetical protein